MLNLSKKFTTVSQKRLFFSQRLKFDDTLDIENRQQFFQTKKIHSIPQTELKKLIQEEFTRIILEVTKEDGYEPEVPLKFIIADRTIKYNVLTKAMKYFQREIPSYELAPIETASNAVDWFYNKFVSEKPSPPLDVPENVSLFIKEFKKKRERKQLEDLTTKQFEKNMKNKLKTKVKYGLE